jgi:hypothetical protein
VTATVTTGVLTMTERQQLVRVAIDTRNTTLFLQLLEQVVIEALQQQILKFPIIVAYCKQELGTDIEGLHPCNIELWASRHGIEWNRES